jgi:hypothetical protein
MAFDINRKITLISGEIDIAVAENCCHMERHIAFMMTDCTPQTRRNLDAFEVIIKKY